jgi:hypothetical protein
VSAGNISDGPPRAIAYVDAEETEEPVEKQRHKKYEVRVLREGCVEHGQVAEHPTDGDHGSS